MFLIEKVKEILSYESIELLKLFILNCLQTVCMGVCVCFECTHTSSAHCTRHQVSHEAGLIMWKVSWTIQLLRIRRVVRQESSTKAIGATN